MDLALVAGNPSGGAPGAIGGFAPVGEERGPAAGGAVRRATGADAAELGRRRRADAAVTIRLSARAPRGGEGELERTIAKTPVPFLACTTTSSRSSPRYEKSTAVIIT